MQRGELPRSVVRGFNDQLEVSRRTTAMIDACPRARPPGPVTPVPQTFTPTRIVWAVLSMGLKIDKRV